jgi:hypothetical protein
MRLPKKIKDNVDAAESRGHKLVSQGCALFRCTGCDRTAFMDGETTASAFWEECPARFKCPHCSKPKEAYNVTCTRSECQEASAKANSERNAARKGRKS